MTCILLHIQVTVSTKFEKYRFILLGVGLGLLYLARALAKSKIFCYSAAVSLLAAILPPCRNTRYLLTRS
jgi:hypothetical protein